MAITGFASGQIGLGLAGLLGAVLGLAGSIWVLVFLRIVLKRRRNPELTQP